MFRWKGQLINEMGGTYALLPKLHFNSFKKKKNEENEQIQINLHSTLLASGTSPFFPIIMHRGWFFTLRFFQPWLCWDCSNVHLLPLSMPNFNLLNTMVLSGENLNVHCVRIDVCTLFISFLFTTKLRHNCVVHSKQHLLLVHFFSTYSW